MFSKMSTEFVLTKMTLVYLLIDICFGSLASADLRVYPTRVIFDKKTRSATVHLRHEGAKPATYRIRMLQYEMDAKGNVAQVEGSDEFINKMKRVIRYAPRLVRMEPKQEQTVRILAHQKGLEDGEYRVHLQFATFEDQDAKKLASNASGDQPIQMQLFAHFGVSIPVLVRVGELHGEVALNAVRVEDRPGAKAALVTLEMSKSGNRSVHGDFEVYRQGGEKPVAQLKGVALYNQRRSVHIPIPKEEVGQTLDIRYTESTSQKTYSVIVQEDKH